MLKRLGTSIFQTVANQQEKARIAELIRVISLTAILLTILGILPQLIFAPVSPTTLVIGALLCLLFTSTYILTRRGKQRFSGFLLAATLWVIITFVTFGMGGLQIIGLGGYLLVIIIASLLFGHRAGNFFFAISMGVSLVMFTAANTEANTLQWLPKSSILFWFSQLIIFVASAVLIHIAFRSLENALSQAQTNQDHLQRRAAQVQVAAEVIRDASAIREMDELLNRAADLIRKRFGFYFVAIYLMEEENQFAVLKAATGTAGDKLLAEGYRIEVGKVGIVGYVAGSGEPRITLNVAQDPVHYVNPELLRTQAELTLPLNINGRTVGVLDVQSDQENDFDDQDVAVLQIVADQLALALETAQLIDTTGRQLHELTILHIVAVACAQAASEDNLIERATEIIGEAFYPDNFGIILLDAEDQSLRKHASYRERIDDGGQGYPLNSGITGKSASEGRALRVADVTKDPYYLEVDPLTRSELCVPLKAGDHTIGVINAESQRLNAFTEEDERLLTTLAGQLASGIQRVRFYGKNQRQVQELEALRQASLRLTSSLELQPVLETILQQALELVAAYDAHIFLLDGSRLTFGAALWENKFHQKPIAEPRQGGLTYSVARQGEKIVVPDVSNHPLFQNQEWYGAIVGLPLIANRETLGVMNFAFSEPHSFTPEELRILELFADQAAVALANANLYHESQARAAALFRALEQLQELDRLKSEFIQNVSHELRTPLAIVLGYAELLESGELGVMASEQQKTMRIMLQRLQTLAKTLDDLLIIVETEARNQTHRPVDLGKLVRETIDEFDAQIIQKQLDPIIDISDHLPLVAATPEHMRRVLDNLFSNAVKFTPPGGQIDIKLYANHQDVILEVHDTGIGISPDQGERIFERFYQIDGSTTRRFGGTGLGLALVREVVEAHRGQVFFSSAPDIGSTFTVKLPAITT